MRKTNHNPILTLQPTAFPRKDEKDHSEYNRDNRKLGCNEFSVIITDFG